MGPATDKHQAPTHRLKLYVRAQLVIQHDLASTLDKGVQTDIVILDLSKAFDRVLHRQLLRKLHHYGIRENINQWITSFLLGRTQRVTVEGCSLDSVPVVSEVPHGSVLGHLLFLLFINDLPDKIISKTRLFADECIVYRPIHDLSDCAVLQQDVDAFTERESRLGMEFHTQKCSVLRVSRSRSPISHCYKLEGHILIAEDTTKYLGVDLQTTLSWKTHIDRITKKSNSMPRFLRHNLRSCSEDTKATTYFSMVRSNLEYCSSVWNPHQKDKIRKLEMI